MDTLAGISRSGAVTDRKSVLRMACPFTLVRDIGRSDSTGETPMATMAANQMAGRGPPRYLSMGL